MSHDCARCGERFARPEHLALHGGQAHGPALEAGERAEFEAALAREEAWLAHFRRHVRGSLAALPVAVTLVLIVLLAYYGGVPVGLTLLLLPGSAAFAAVLYYMAFTREVPGN